MRTGNLNQGTSTLENPHMFRLATAVAAVAVTSLSTASKGADV